MLIPIRSAQFKRDIKRLEKRHKNTEKLRILLLLLIEQKPFQRNISIIRSRAIGKATGTFT